MSRVILRVSSPAALARMLGVLAGVSRPVRASDRIMRSVCKGNAVGCSRSFRSWVACRMCRGYVSPCCWSGADSAMSAISVDSMASAWLNLLAEGLEVPWWM